MYKSGTAMPPTAFTVGLEVQGTLLEAAVDTGAEVSVLCTQVYDQLKVKPSIKRHVKMLQAGDNTSLRGFVWAHLMLGSDGAHTGWICIWPPSRTPCCWG